MIMGQLTGIAVILLIIVAIVAWTSKSKAKKDRGCSVIDTFLSKFKVVIGFYQVTYGVLEAFSYITWPDSIQAIGKYSEIFQLNIFQITPVHCLFPGFHEDAFSQLFGMMAINAAVVGFSGVAYGVRKVIILRTASMDDETKSQEMSLAKEVWCKNVFFFLYVTYLSTCSKTAKVLPFACRDLCQDEKDEICNKYLKADYSIQCDVPGYNKLIFVAYFSCAYLVALPTASFVALWRQRRAMLTTRAAETFHSPGPGTEMITGLRFLFENYKLSSWYWEFVDMARKVILTSGLILVGQESRSYIGLAWVMAGMYGMLFTWSKPIEDVSENRLMTVSLAVTVVNLAVGAVSKIPAENISGSSDPFIDAYVINVLVIAANTLVIGLVVGRILLLLLIKLISYCKLSRFISTR